MTVGAVPSNSAARGSRRFLRPEGFRTAGDRPRGIDLGDDLLGAPRVLPALTFREKNLREIFARRLGPPFGEGSS
jgi:hypothetical protein